MTHTLILDRKFFSKCFENISILAEEQRDYWTKLDSDIGDGDHGINLSIGFRGVSQVLPELENSETDLKKLFKKVGMTLLSKVGGASGPLYGSLFMKMGDDLEGRQEVTFDEFVLMLDKGVAAVLFRGKAEIGDKTMIDALVPGIEALKNSNQGQEPAKRMQEFIEVMKKGAMSTTELVARKGRAVRLGERAVGHRDPGAESSWMIMNVFYEEIVKASKNIGVD